MKRYLLVFGLLVAISLAGCDPKKNTPSLNEAEFLESKGLTPPLPNQMAPDFTFTLMNGKQAKLSDFRGEWIFLNFWATWCMPCRHEMPDMEELSIHFGDRNFKMLAISTGEIKAKVNYFLEQYPYSFEIAIDEDQTISNLYQVQGLPTTFLISPEGKIYAVAVGPRPWRAEEFLTWMDSKLKKVR